MSKIHFLPALILILFFSAQADTQYHLYMNEPHLNYFQVEIEYTPESADPVEFVMPAWTPGYYVIINQARNIVNVLASDEHGEKLILQKMDKQHWQVKNHGGRKIKLSYRVYAYTEGNPYSAHLQKDFAFYNGAFLFMYVAGEESNPHHIKFHVPEGWDYHSSIPQRTKKFEYTAKNYLEIVDSPAFFGDIEKIEFTVQNKKHWVILNSGYEFNRQRVINDLTKLVEYFYTVFGELPYSEYTFFLRIDKHGHGGIEHSNSNASCISPQALPNSDNPGDLYFTKFLMLESHEYFHLYNVKRIRPTGMDPFDFTKESYTNLMWFSEGFTSYYTARPLAKSGITDLRLIFDSWENYYNAMHNNSSLAYKSIADISFDSWNDASTIPDYSYRAFYYKGALIGLLLDIDMRLKSNHKKTMDGFFKYVFEYNYKMNRTLDDKVLLNLFNEYTGHDYTSFFNQYIYGTEQLPVFEYLEKAGIQAFAKDLLPDFGLKVELDDGPRPKVNYCYPGSPADKLEIGRGDIILSINHQKVTSENYLSILRAIDLNKNYKIEWLHLGKNFEGKIKVKNMRATGYNFELNPNPTPEQTDFIQKWLLP